MAGKQFLGVMLFSFSLLFATNSDGRADEDQLLQKFKQQNQSSAAKLKTDVTTNLAHAESPSRDPEKSLDVLRKNLKQLQDDGILSKGDRAHLIRQVIDRVSELKEVVAEKKRRETPKPNLDLVRAPEERLVGPGPVDMNRPQGHLNVGQVMQPVPVGGQLAGITPAVSADRTRVRVSINGTFFAPRFVWVPHQFAIPTTYYGPGKGFTIGQPEKIFQVFLPQIATMAVLGVNTTVNVPDGGVAVVGGFNYSAESRGEFGTPVLSHIPYVGRLFRNVSYGRDSGSTRIMVAPRIISLEEEEQKLLGNR